MKKITPTLALLMLVFMIGNVTAQECAFDSQREKLRLDPSYVQLEQAAEQKIQNIISNNNTANRMGTVYTIPVVIHVLHLGEAVGSGTNISDAQIQSSIDNLNDYYRGLIPTSPVDFEIEFTLAQRDPNCGSTTGINRIDASGLTGYSDFGVNVQNSNGTSYNDIVALSSWPQTDYLNIWIVSELDGNDGGFGFQGYAYFYNETFSTHGSVMMSSVFGYDPGNTNGWGLNSNGDNSTVVHEIGHFFHLYHTFQGDASGANCPADSTVGNDSDGCADTVPHRRETSTCPSTNSCTGNPWVDNNTINNIMSYYNCADRLTNDQKTRARAAMTGTTLVDESKGDEPPVTAFVAPSSVCSANSPAGTNLAGIMSAELNGTIYRSSTTGGDGGNIDKSINCSGVYEIDTQISNTLSVTIASGNVHQLGVWIDWNDDGDFNDDNEQQHLSNDIDGGDIVAVTLTYPSSIPHDDFVRLRLVTDVDDRYGGVSLIDSPCYTNLVYGQSEDYSIYVQPEVLSIENNELNDLNIYSTTSPKELVIKGQLTESTIANLYDIQGRLVLKRELYQNNIYNTIDVSAISTGIYIIKIDNDSLSISKKLIIN